MISDLPSQKQQVHLLVCKSRILEHFLVQNSAEFALYAMRSKQKKPQLAVRISPTQTECTACFRRVSGFHVQNDGRI